VAASATPFVGGAEDQLVVLLDQPAERHAVTGLGARDHAARRIGGSRAFPVIKLGHQCQELPAPAAAAFPIWNSDACRWPFLGGKAKYSRPAMARAGEEDYLCAARAPAIPMKAEWLCSRPLFCRVIEPENRCALFLITL